MDKIRELLAKQPVIGAGVSLAIGLFLGLIIGWFGIGWGVWPVEWKDASVRELRADLRVDYLRLAVESYVRTPDDAAAVRRWVELGDKQAETLSTLKSDPSINPAAVEVFSHAVGAGGGVGAAPVVPGAPAGTAQPGQAETAAAKPTDALSAMLTTTAVAPESSSGSPMGINLVYLLLILIVLTLVIGGVLVYLLFIRPKNAASGASQSAEKSAPVQATGVYDYSHDEQGEPIAQYMTAYALGDDLYDDSFSIDSPNGEFLGECGVGVSDTIGVGDPKKVSAFEVWLFDKNDIQTVTKVLMSEHAFNDPEISQKLAAKGEPVLVSPGKNIILETATLQMEARIVDMSYGQGALPQSSFFDRMTLELAVWPKHSG
jgi:hypothetical protein